MDTSFRGITISRGHVIEALNDFSLQYPDPNDYDHWLDKASYRYAIEYDGRRYPPKHILSVVTGISTRDFSGGEETNRVFRALGFDVGWK